MVSVIRGDDNFDSANAGPSATVGAVGTYAFLGEGGANFPARAPGDTLAGSSLLYAVAVGGTGAGPKFDSVSPSGTWRLMGGYSDSISNNDDPASVWLRIS